MDEFAFAPELLEAATEEQLRSAVVAINGELQRRAILAADTGALVEEAFASGFTAKGLPRDPYLRSGVLVAMGAKIDRSALAHECCFVRVGASWVWECDGVFEDVVRHLPGPRPVMRTVSLVAAAEGTAVDLVSARTRQGVHELVGVRSFVVDDGELTLVSARAVAKVSHRPGG